MILLALGLIAFGVGDLIRWTPDRVTRRRAGLAVVVSVAGAFGLVLLAGEDAARAAVAAAGTFVAFGVWVALDYVSKPGYQLAWIVAVFGLLLGLAGSADVIGGPLESWYAGLGFGFVESVSADRFVIGVGGVVFLTATVNRIVQLVLAAAVDDWEEGESAIKGGRLLGPLERLIIMGVVLTGDPAAAAIVITGKGLLRFPEIRGAGNGDDGPSLAARTEYFLVGTFTSLLIAALVAVAVLAAG